MTDSDQEQTEAPQWDGVHLDGDEYVAECTHCGYTARHEEPGAVIMLLGKHCAEIPYKYRR